MKTSLSASRRVTFGFVELVVNGIPVQQDRDTGSHDPEHLTLGKWQIADRDIRSISVVEEQTRLEFVDEESRVHKVVLRVLPDPDPLTRAINYGLSRRQYAERLEQVATRHQGHLTRQADCPWCEARLLVMDGGEGWSPQVWCEYCDSLFTIDPVEGLGDTERDYRICPECLMYSRPRRFSEAYFYFLIIHAGVHHTTTRCCSGCMRPRAWRMVLGNLPGLLGLPFAMTQLVRVYRDSTGPGPLRGLDSANRMLRRGRTTRALARYSAIMERHPVSAGVLYNVALGLVAGGDPDNARRTLQLALENCPNYRPAREKLEALEVG